VQLIRNETLKVNRKLTLDFYCRLFGDILMVSGNFATIFTHFSDDCDKKKKPLDDSHEK
jgi:hypothetical protein